MKQVDWVSGAGRAAAPFKDIRNTRPSVAEEKAQRLLVLGGLVRQIPASVRDGSIQTVREWRVARDAAAKVAASQRSSVLAIESAISSLRRWIP